MVYFLSLVDHDKFQIIFNLNDVKMMTKKSKQRGEIIRDPNSAYFSARLVTGTPLLVACNRLPSSAYKTMIIDYLTRIGLNPNALDNEESS